MRKVLSAILSLLLAFSTMLSAAIPAFAEDNTAKEIVNSLTLKQKIGQMFMTCYRVYDGEKVTALNDEIRDSLSDLALGGVILFAENIKGTVQTAELINDFQASATADKEKNSIPLLVAVDQESGRVVRLATGTTLSSNMSLGAINDTGVTEEYAGIIGSELKALGFNVDFAPDMDVNNNPDNPVIGNRSFSSDASIVAEQGSAFITGLHNEGISSAIKHFPGHGDTATDSHTGLPLINKTYDEIKNLELIPFKSGIDAGTDIVMTAHIQYPQIETTTVTSKSTGEEIYLPATLSKTIITDILRGDMGFDGVVTTDAMDMDAIKENFGKLDACTLAINAGVDLLLMPVNVKSKADIDELSSLIDGIADLVDKGGISIDRINESCERLIDLKLKRGILKTKTEGGKTVICDNDNYVNPADALKVVGSEEHHAKEYEIAQKSITVLKNENGALPIENGENVKVFMSPTSMVAHVESVIEGLRAKGVIGSETKVTVESYSDGRVFSESEIDLEGFDKVILINRMFSSSEFEPKDGSESSFIDSLIDYTQAQGKQIIFVSANLPYDTARFEKADALAVCYYSSKTTPVYPLEYNGELATYSASIYACFGVLFGEAEPCGKLPVDVYALDENYRYTDTVLFKLGDGLTTLAEAEDNENENNGEQDGNNSNNSNADVTDDGRQGGEKNCAEENKPTGDAFTVLIAAVLLSSAMIIAIVPFKKKYNQ